MVAMRIATGKEVAEAIKHCGQSADLVGYCKERLEKQFARAKLTKEPAVQQLLKQLMGLEEQFSQVQAMREKDIWLGVLPQSNHDIQTQLTQTAMLQNMSEEGVERLKFRYAIAEDGQFIRAFGMDGQAVKDAVLLQQLDDIVHKEFAKQHLSLDANGRLLSVEDGKQIPANLAQLQAVCKGLEKICNDQNIRFIAQPESYPATTPNVTRTGVPVQEPAKTIDTLSSSQETVVTPEAPSAGPGAQN